LGPQTLKNIDRPIQFYRLAGKDGPAAVLSTIDLPLPQKPSIVVLPFANMSADAEQEYFVDGLTEDLITDLSKVPQLFVIAQNSSFA
jgi:TolB-like protein